MILFVKTSCLRLFERSGQTPPGGWTGICSPIHLHRGCNSTRVAFRLPTSSWEVAVEHEHPDELMADCQAYFGINTSTTLWIGIKIWLAGEKIWVGYATRAPNGVGGIVTSSMNWVPNHTSFLVPIPINIIYSIPIQMVFGQGIPVPPGTPPTLDIDVERIRHVIFRNV
jgi:hypothetical protein